MKIKEDIYYVGVLDRDAKVFDALMNINYGTSYNAYLIKGKEKNALIDTVKAEFTDEYIKNIEKYIDIRDVNYLIVNHTEPDHSGAIARVLELNPEVEVCGTKMAIDFVRNIVNFDFKSNVLTANDSIDLGGKELKFFAFPMLHWPDSMYTYLKEDEMLFTCDSFGVHYATDELFNDLVEDDVLTDKAIIGEYKYYFDKILGPFKTPFLLNALNKISLLPIKYICPGHGMVIRKDVDKYIEMYKSWCLEENKTRKITICYISSYGYTKKIANALYNGAKKVLDNVKIYDLQDCNLDDAKRDLYSSDGIMLGSPTILSDALPQIYEIMSGLNPVVNKSMSALTFGSYAWSGEATLNIMQCLKMLRFDTPFDPIRVKLNPSPYDIEQIEKTGENFANVVLNK